MAVSFHKLVSERGVWEDDLLREAEIAWMSGTEKGQEVAMLKLSFERPRARNLPGKASPTRLDKRAERLDVDLVLPYIKQ